MSNSSAARHQRLIMLALLWLLYTAFGLVSRSIFPLVTPILEDLQISYSQMGIILGSWQLTYIFVALAAGTIIDQWGARKSILAGTVMIALSAALRYYADGFLSMLLAVALFGAGGPMISIGGPKTIAQWFVGRSRGTAVGVYTTGNWVGGLLALALTNSVLMPLVGYSWRLSFATYGLLTLIVGLLWWLLAAKEESTVVDESPAVVEVFGNLIKIRNMRILLIMALFSFAVGHGFSSWLPKILEIKGLSASQAGVAAALPIAAGIPAILLIPRVVRPRLRGRIIALFALLTTINLLYVVKITGIALYIALAALGFISSPFMPLMLLIMMDSRELNPRHLGVAGGMFFCVAEIGGVAGPFIMGMLMDVTGTFLSGTVFLASLCIAIAVLTLFLNPAAADRHIAA
jgi:cyanate permease